MYLADVQIRERLDELAIECPDPDLQFDPDRQVQPCSIDLHVSNVFWRPRHRRRLVRRALARLRGGSIDLRRGDIGQLRLLRDWRQVRLRAGQSHIIHPGEVLMGRVYERLTIPVDCAGKIEGRSSYSRLGLGVHLTGDFINPGWGGYMPVQLFNAGPYPIRITPYLPICQLMLIPLTATPSRTYGDPELRSKYVNDDGGPSLWWLDAQVERLQRRLDQASVATVIQAEVIERVRFQDATVLRRLERYLGHLRDDDIDSETLLRRFAKRERLRKLADGVVIAIPPILVALSATFFAAKLDTVGTGLAASLLIALPSAAASWIRREAGYYSFAEAAPTVDK
jgi:deoxycytidine triphosphate deaminase